MRRRGAAVLVLLGLVLMLFSVSLVGYNLWDSRRARAASVQAADALMERILTGETKEETASAAEQELAPETAELPEDISQDVPQNIPQDISQGNPAASSLSSWPVDGTEYIGVLEIPYFDLTLPVARDCNDYLLRFSPCRFSGTPEGKDLMICAHNYPSHFGRLNQSRMGLDVFLTTVDGTVYQYQVSNWEVMQMDEVGRMVSDETKDWDLTLFTCTLDGISRCAVRCIAVGF